MKNSKINKIIISGMSLPIAMMFTIGGAGILYSFYSNMYSRNWNINYEITKYKAKLNAHSGIAYAMGNYLYRKDFLSVSDSIDKRVNINNIYPEHLDINKSVVPAPSKMGIHKQHFFILY